MLGPRSVSAVADDVGARRGGAEAASTGGQQMTDQLMDKEDKLFLVGGIIGFIVAFAAVLYFSTIYWHGAAISHGYAEYDAMTGSWQWKATVTSVRTVTNTVTVTNYANIYMPLFETTTNVWQRGTIFTNLWHSSVTPN
jgi:hypothetical protein